MPYMQTYSSKNTSINSTQYPYIYNHLNWDLLKGGVILDYGCGRYTSHLRWLCRKNHCRFVGFDPFWYSDVENMSAMRSKPDFIICNNVLNVINSDFIMEWAHRFIISFGVPYGIKIYEGDKTGWGRVTKKDCYQRNQRVKDYLKEDEIIYKGIITRPEYKKYFK